MTGDFTKIKDPWNVTARWDGTWHVTVNWLLPSGSGMAVVDLKPPVAESTSPEALWAAIVSAARPDRILPAKFDPPRRTEDGWEWGGTIQR